MTPPADPSPPAAKRRKKRLPISCLECRTRKERCDRNVPGCANCRKRSVDCRWGDERDENVASSSSYGSPAATATPRSVARKTQTEASSTASAVVASAANTNSSNAIEGSLQGIESYASGGRFDLSLSSLSTSEQASRRRKLALNIASRLPSKELTHELAERHLDLSHHAFYCIDMQDFFLAVDELWPALEALRGPAPSSSSTERFRPIRFDVLACLLMVLAASAQEMPRTYLIGLGLVSTSEQVSSTISTWLEDGLDCIDLCQRQAELTMTALQAICIFELWLADRVPVYRQTSLLDLAARSAARLGLDRLSNDERDRLAWKQPSFGRPQSSQSGPLSWGAARFFAKDAHSREIGRAVWYIVSMLLSVTVTFYYWNPRSAVDSMPPGQLISLQDEAAYNPCATWPLYASLSGILQEWTRLMALSEARGAQPDYEAYIGIHTKLSYLHQELPASDLTHFQLFQRPGESNESYRNREKKIAQKAFAAFLLQCKFLRLHRPFMSAGYRQPKEYGLSRDTALTAAEAVIEGVRRFHEHGWAMISCVIAKHTLLQAALVIILDLFVRPTIMASPEGRTRQRLLNVAIERLKDGSDCYDPSSSLYDVGNKLEKLLSACAQRRKVVEADPSKSVCTSSSSPLTPPDALAFTTAGKLSQGGADLFSLDQLDSQLLRFGGRSQAPHPPSVSNNKKGQEPSASLASASAGSGGTSGDNTGIGDLSMLSDVALQQQLNDSSYTPPSSLDMPMPASWEDPFASDQDGVMDWEKVWADIFSTVGMAR